MQHQITVEERDIFDQMLKQLGENLDVTPTGIDWDKINHEIKPFITPQPEEVTIHTKHGKQPSR